MLRKTLTIMLEVFFGTAVVLAVLAATYAWRLSQGPVSASFLLPYASGLLKQENRPFKVELEGLVLRWAGWNRALDVRATGLVFKDNKAEKPVARVREMSISLSFRGLLKGEIAPTSLEIIRPLIHLNRKPNGMLDVDVAASASASPDGTSEKIFQALLAFLAAPTKGEAGLEYLDRVSIIGASIRVKDDQLDVSWGAPHADITITRAPLGLKVNFNLDAVLKNSQPRLKGKLYFNRNIKTISGIVFFEKVDTQILSQEIPRAALLRLIDTNLSGNAEFTIGLDGSMETKELTLSAGPGYLTVPGYKTSPIRFQHIDFNGNSNKSLDQLKIERLDITLPHSTIYLKGAATRVGGSTAFNTTVSFNKLPINDLKRYWFPSLAPKVRSWITEKLIHGTVNNASINLSARAFSKNYSSMDIELDSLIGSFAIDGAIIKLSSSVDPITNVHSTVTFNKQNIDFSIQSGRLENLEIENGKINISDIGNDENVSIDLRANGPVSDTLKYLVKSELKLFGQMGFLPEIKAGNHTTQLKLNFPLNDDLTFQEVQWEVLTDIQDFWSSNIIHQNDIKKGNFNVRISNRKITAEGTANLSGTPTRFKWLEDLTGTIETKRKIEARLTAGADLRKGFQLDFPKFIEGPVAINLVYRKGKNGKETLSAGLNLKEAKLSLPGFGWAKLPGRNGTAALSAVLTNGRVSSVPLFQVDAGVFSTIGTLTFSAVTGPSDSLKLKAARFEKFKLGPTVFRANLSTKSDGILTVQILGEGFDATPFITDNDVFTTANLPALKLNAKFTKFWFGPGSPANNVNILLQRDKKNWQRVKIYGLLPNGGKEVSVSMKPHNNGHNLSLYSADAGMVLRVLDITNTVKGGSIEVSGFRHGLSDAPWRGLAEMKRFRISNAPSFARLLTLASLTGITSTLVGKGIAFDRLRFSYLSQNGKTTINAGQAVGSELGITAAGSVNFTNNQINLNGTIVPAYSINSLLAKVPLIGPLITGESGGGIFAASYTVKGSIEKPKMSVNPLSALAPGFLRRLLPIIESESDNNDTVENDSKN